MLSVMSQGASTMQNERHLLLLVDLMNGQPRKEPVHVTELGEGRFRLLHSAGLVEGIAAGDEFHLRDKDGSFGVASRSGNLALQVFSPTPIGDRREELTARVPGSGVRWTGRL